MKKQIEIRRIWSDENLDVSTIHYEKSLLGFIESNKSIEFGLSKLELEDKETPLFKTYSMRYKWFDYKSFLSIGGVPLHIGNRNISTSPFIVFGASVNDVMTNTGVYNGEKVMKYFYELFYYPISNGILSVDCLISDLL